MIGLLDRLGQREEFLRLRFRFGDHRARHAMIGDDREAEPLERSAERLRETFGIAHLLREADGGDGGTV